MKVFVSVVPFKVFFTLLHFVQFNQLLRSFILANYRFLTQTNNYNESNLTITTFVVKKHH